MRITDDLNRRIMISGTIASFGVVVYSLGTDSSFFSQYLGKSDLTIASKLYMLAIVIMGAIGIAVLKYNAKWALGIAKAVTGVYVSWHAFETQTTQSKLLNLVLIIASAYAISEGLSDIIESVFKPSSEHTYQT